MISARVICPISPLSPRFLSIDQTPSGHSPTHRSHPAPTLSSKKISGPEGTVQPGITGHISTFICILKQAQTVPQQLLGRSHRVHRAVGCFSWHPLPPPPSSVIREQTEPDLDMSAKLGVSDSTVLKMSFCSNRNRPPR